MADEKKEASGIAAEAGGTSHEAEAKEAIEWWHPATMMLSSTCTNCKAELEPQTGTAAGDGGANSEQQQQQQQRGSGGKGACSRCHRAFYCGPQVGSNCNAIALDSVSCGIFMRHANWTGGTSFYCVLIANISFQLIFGTTTTTTRVRILVVFCE